MLYLDSADREALAPLLETGLFSGVTTNPLILDRAGLGAEDLPELVEWLHGAGVSRIYAQATGATTDAIRASARAVADIDETLVIKIVATSEALPVARELAESGREVLVTAVYHPAQAALAAAAGATEIAPYVGRATERGRDGIELVRRIAALPGAPRILAASLRSPDQLAAVLAAGAPDATLSPQVAQLLLHDELTVAAAEEFEAVVGAVRSPAGGDGREGGRA